MKLTEDEKQVLRMVDDLEGRLGEAQRIGAQAMGVKPEEIAELLAEIARLRDQLAKAREQAFEEAARAVDSFPCNPDYSGGAYVVDIAAAIRALATQQESGDEEADICCAPQGSLR